MAKYGRRFRMTGYKTPINSGDGGGGYPAGAFVFTIDTDNTDGTSNAAGVFELPLISAGSYSFNVDWGDGSDDDITVWNQAEATHTYSVSGQYTVICTITSMVGWAFNNLGDKTKFTTVEQWGDVVFNFNSTGQFYGCNNFTAINATDNPTLSTTTARFFYNCSSLATWGTVSTWDVSLVDQMFDMFRGCTLFDEDLSAWDVSSVINFSSIFRDSAFDNGGNDDIDNWDVSTATTFTSMFRSTPFARDISGWVTTSATSMEAMFFNCDLFNINISGWDVSGVTNFTNMFSGCAIFNQPIGLWTTTSMQSIQTMLMNVDSFDQDLSNWDISNLTNGSNFMNSATGLSTSNYDATLIAWDAQAVQSGVAINFGGSIYTLGGAAEAARSNLISSDSWTITDGGGV